MPQTSGDKVKNSVPFVMCLVTKVIEFLGYKKGSIQFKGLVSIKLLTFD